jgi:hypothetical protein
MPLIGQVNHRKYTFNRLQFQTIKPAKIKNKIVIQL